MLSSIQKSKYNLRMNKERQAKLDNALGQILQVLKKEYRPQKVILFGSMASGAVDGMCQFQSFSKFQADCVVVDQYYTPTRYPDAVPGNLLGGSPSEIEAKEAVDLPKQFSSL